MVEVEFNYQHNITIIQANINDSLKKIINKFINKTNLDLKTLYFLSNGKNLNNNETIKKIMSESDIKNKKIIILVQNINNNINIGNTNIVNSNDIICPTCK